MARPLKATWLRFPKTTCEAMYFTNTKVILSGEDSRAIPRRREGPQGRWAESGCASEAPSDPMDLCNKTTHVRAVTCLRCLPNTVSCGKRRRSRQRQKLNMRIPRENRQRENDSDPLIQGNTTETLERVKLGRRRRLSTGNAQGRQNRRGEPQHSGGVQSPQRRGGSAPAPPRPAPPPRSARPAHRARVHGHEY